MRVVDGAVANTISNSVNLGIPPLIEFINDVIHLDKYTRLLEDKLSRMKNLLEEMSSKLQPEQKVQNKCLSKSRCKLFMIKLKMQEK